MPLIEISETQLAFGYLHSFMHFNKLKSFILPSIRQEGNLNFHFSGADLIIEENHLIQFKRPFYLVSDNIQEFKDNQKPSDIEAPYYRFYIKNDKPTRQLDNLIDATKKGLSAEYIAPMFKKDTEFFALLEEGHDSLLQQYACIDISQFDKIKNKFKDSSNHTILYNEKTVDEDFCYCFSKPTKIKVKKIEPNSINKEKEHSDEVQLQKKSFQAIDVIQIISSIFFPREELLINNKEIKNKKELNTLLLEQCRLLQFQLLLKKDIIWFFSVK